MNLVNNAFDALIEHKIINPRVDIMAATDNDAKTAQITIRDNGLGISNEISKTLFDPFVTRKKSNGTGLGLTIVKQYILAHGGNIKAVNDEGAVFTISLPLQDE
jgi:signal transduction histidine kinase